MVAFAVEPFVLLLYQAGSAQLGFYLIKDRWVESSEFGPKSDDLGHRILKSDFIPSDFAKSDCISRPILFQNEK